MIFVDVYRGNNPIDLSIFSVHVNESGYMMVLTGCNNCLIKESCLNDGTWTISFLKDQYYSRLTVMGTGANCFDYERTARGLKLYFTRGANQSDPQVEFRVTVSK